MPKPPPYADWNHFKVCEESSEDEEEEEEEVGQQEDKDEKGQDDNDVQEEQRSRSPEKRRGSSLMLGRYFVLPAGIYLSAGGASHAGPLPELLTVAPSSSGAHLSEEAVNEEEDRIRGRQRRQWQRDAILRQRAQLVVLREPARLPLRELFSRCGDKSLRQLAIMKACLVDGSASPDFDEVDAKLVDRLLCRSSSGGGVDGGGGGSGSGSSSAVDHGMMLFIKRAHAAERELRASTAKHERILKALRQRVADSTSESLGDAGVSQQWVVKDENDDDVEDDIEDNRDGAWKSEASSTAGEESAKVAEESRVTGSNATSGSEFCVGDLRDAFFGAGTSGFYRTLVSLVGHYDACDEATSVGLVVEYVGCADPPGSSHKGSGEGTQKATVRPTSPTADGAFASRASMATTTRHRISMALHTSARRKSSSPSSSSSSSSSSPKRVASSLRSLNEESSLPDLSSTAISGPSWLRARARGSAFDDKIRAAVAAISPYELETYGVESESELLATLPTLEAVHYRSVFGHLY